MLRRPVVPFAVALASVLSLAGCNKTAPQASPDGAAQSSSASSEADSIESPGYVLEVRHVSLAAEKTSDARRFDNPTPEVIQEQFSVQKWDDDDIRPLLSLDRIGGDEIQMIQVQREPYADGRLHVVLTMVVGNELFNGESTQIESSDRLLEMLLAFRNQDSKITTMIDWDDSVRDQLE